MVVLLLVGGVGADVTVSKLTGSRRFTLDKGVTVETVPSMLNFSVFMLAGQRLFKFWNFCDSCLFLKAERSSLR